MYPAITLDGFIADLDGKCYDWISDEDEQVYMDMISKAGCAIVGRKTFEQYREDFPHENGAMTFVYTTDESHEDEEGITFLNGSPEQVVETVEAKGFSEMIVTGGGKLNGSLAEAGLIDEIIVSIYPVMLGEGIPLFGTHKPKMNLELLSTTNEIDGIVKNHYKVQKEEE